MFFLGEKGLNLKKCLYSLPSNSWLSKMNGPKFLKICQFTNFDMGFQKKQQFKPIKKVDFFQRRVSQTKKQNSTSSKDLFSKGGGV